MSRSALFVAASTRRQYLAYCREHGLDPHNTRYIRLERDLLGCRGGHLTILPGNYDWPRLMEVARVHEIDVKII